VHHLNLSSERGHLLDLHCLRLLDGLFLLVDQLGELHSLLLHCCELIFLLLLNFEEVLLMLFSFQLVGRL